MSTWLKLILGAAFLCATVLCSFAYIYSQVGVDSNFLVDDGRVIFTQSDGTLTVLSLETGQVLRRVKGHDFTGRLRRFSSGILCVGYRSIDLLNPTNFMILWETSFSYQPNICGNTLVSYDGYGLVENRDLKSGKVLWAFNLPGALDMAAENRCVIVLRAGTYESNHVSTLALLDLDTGKELWRKTPPQHIHWPNAYFDGEKIYLKEASYNIEPSNYSLERIVVLSTNGEEVGAIALDAQMKKDLRWTDAFDLDGKHFENGHVYTDEQAVSQQWTGYRRHLLSTNRINESIYEFSNGAVFISREDCRQRTRGSALQIEWRAAEGNGAGTLPYLPSTASLTAVAQIDGKFVIGSNLGQVECINSATGESEWLYSFPTLRQTMSYSSPNGMPPMMATAAAIYRNENKNPPTNGFLAINRTAKPTRVIRDPEPANPFEKLPQLLSIAWSGAAIPLVILGALRFSARTRQRNLGPLAFLLISVPFFCFIFFGRVSLGSSIALRIAMIVIFTFGMAGAISYLKERKWLFGILLLAGLAVVAFVMRPFLLRL